MATTFRSDNKTQTLNNANSCLLLCIIRHSQPRTRTIIHMQTTHTLTLFIVFCEHLSSL